MKLIYVFILVAVQLNASSGSQQPNELCIFIKTSADEYAGTDSTINFHLVGQSFLHSKSFSMSGKGDNFEANKYSNFCFIDPDLNKLGIFQKIKIEKIDVTSSYTDWKLEYLKIVHNNVNYQANCNCWFRIGDKTNLRELSLSNDFKPPPSKSHALWLLLLVPLLVGVVVAIVCLRRRSASKKHSVPPPSRPPPQSQTARQEPSSPEAPRVVSDLSAQINIDGNGESLPLSTSSVFVNELPPSYDDASRNFSRATQMNVQFRAALPAGSNAPAVRSTI